MIVSAGLAYVICKGYIDDFIVHGQDDSDLLLNLRQVFERCRQYRIAFNPKKCKIGLWPNWLGRPSSRCRWHTLLRGATQWRGRVPDACRGKGVCVASWVLLIITCQAVFSQRRSWCTDYTAHRCIWLRLRHWMWWLMHFQDVHFIIIAPKRIQFKLWRRWMKSCSQTSNGQFHNSHGKVLVPPWGVLTSTPPPTP